MDLPHPNLSATPTDLILQLLRQEQVGPVGFYRLLNQYGSIEAALTHKKPSSGLVKAIDDEMKFYHSQKISIIPYGHHSYPPHLLHIHDAPPVLMVRGETKLLTHPNLIAMVGARNASAAHARFAKELAHTLGDAGHVIVSGLARGIDTAVHGGALHTGTIGVSAVGIDRIYPSQNSALYAEMAEQGCIISERPKGASPVREAFPQRNRIIAGMCRAVIVIEASEKSGSLITARMALNYGREVMAVPGSPLDSRNHGSNRLIQQGALLVNSAEDVLEALAHPWRIQMPATTSQSVQDDLFVAPIEEKAEMGAEKVHAAMATKSSQEGLLSYLSPSPITLDALAEASQLPAHQLMAELTELELAGKVERRANQQVCLAVAAMNP